MESQSPDIILFASFISTLDEKKRLKVTRTERAGYFENLCSLVNDKMLHRNNDFAPILCYCMADRVREEPLFYINLSSESDIEEMIKHFPNTRDVRILVCHDRAHSDVSDARSYVSLSRGTSQEVRAIWDQLKRKCKEPGDDEKDFFVNPSTGELQEVKLSDFVECHWIGDGSFGEVHKVQLHDGQVFAKKLIKNITIRSGRQSPSDAFKREMTFLKRSTDWENRHIIKFHGFIRVGREAHLILEYLDWDLRKAVDLNKERNLYNNFQFRQDLEDLGYIMLYQLSRALEMVHGLNPQYKMYMHRDIKVSNIMVKTSEARFVLIDFGTTKEIADREFHSGHAGCNLYLAPECVNSPKYDEKCDIWALGISLITYLTGRHPIWEDGVDCPSTSNSYSYGTSPDEMIQNRIRGRRMNGYDEEDFYHPIELQPVLFSEDLRAIVGRCVDRDPRTRASAEYITRAVEPRVREIDTERVQQLFFDFFPIQKDVLYNVHDL